MQYFKSALLAAAVFTASVGIVSAQNAVMYTSYPIAEIEIVQKGVKDQQGINLSTVNGSSAVVLRRIEAEAAKPEADLFWSSTAATMTPFKENFEPYQAPALENVPEDLYYEGHVFVPTGMGIIGFMYNEDYLDGLKAPEKWADLAAPEWKGKILMPNPESGGTGYHVVYGLSQMLGEETFKALTANMVMTESYRSLAPAVASGEYVVSPIYEAAPLEYIDGGQTEIKMVYPQDGVLINVEYAGVVKNAPNGEAGKKVIDTLLSKEVQTQLLVDRFRRPVRNDIRIADHLDLPELDDIVIFRFDELVAASQRTEVLEAFRKLPKAN